MVAKVWTKVTKQTVTKFEKIEYTHNQKLALLKQFSTVPYKCLMRSLLLVGAFCSK
jgi:hypothetical protein